MSQDPYGYQPQPVGYSPQYSFWPYYQATPQQLLAPAKTAGWLLLALGALLVIATSCIGAAVYSLPDAEIQKILQQAAQQQPEIKQFNPTPGMVRAVYGTMAAVIGVYGLLCIPTGLFVRRGTILPIIIGLVLTCLPLLFVAVMFLVSLASGVQGVLSFICVAGIPALLLISATAFLIRAAGNTSKIAQSQQQMTAMYQQQMQQYYAHQQPPEQGGAAS